MILRTTLTVAFSIVANATVISNAVESGAISNGAFDSGALEFKVLSPDGKQTIGSTRFMVVVGGSTEEVMGKTTYLDGEHDDEDEHLRLTEPDSIPRLDTYQHFFFNADGTLKMIDTLNAKSGLASCATYAGGRRKVRSAQLQVPADSFAGASGLLTVIARLRQGKREIKFHAFACGPGPRIFSVAASVPDRSEHWPLYPGDLVRLDMRPDLGALNLLLAPLMPTMDAWFDPNDNWNYVGGEFDRYFRGPHVLMLRVRQPH